MHHAYLSEIEKFVEVGRISAYLKLILVPFQEEHT
jgi:hypothetical protein